LWTALPTDRPTRCALVAQTPGVAGTEAIRRTNGARIVGELIVSAPCTLPLERVAAIKAELATRSGKQWPQADLTITANPIALDDETIVERVLLIGTRLRMPVHHVVIQDVGGRKSMALDLEVDSAMNLKSGHSIGSDLEAAIAAEVPTPLYVPWDETANSMALWPSLAPRQGSVSRRCCVARQTLYSRARS
jgi:divalent metal cation (Fe/Co/Zn/Cd) transporter